MDLQKISEEIRKITYAGTYNKPLQNRVIRLFEKGLVKTRLYNSYLDFHQRVEAGEDVGEAVLDAFDIDVKIRAGGVTNIPKEGPVLIVGNHPFGIVDGMVAASVINRHRGDIKIVAHKGISGLSEFARYFLPIDFDGSKEARNTNVDSIRKFKTHLEDGGVGVIFPAGAVSTRKPLWKKNADPPWQPSAAKWAKQFNCTVVPIFIDGNCGPFFQFVSQFSMTLRLSALLYENSKLIGTEIGMRIGEPIDLKSLPEDWDATQTTQFLREKVYGLAGLSTYGQKLKSK
jgi:putative hemolysin